MMPEYIAGSRLLRATAFWPAKFQTRAFSFAVDAVNKSRDGQLHFHPSLFDTCCLLLLTFSSLARASSNNFLFYTPPSHTLLLHLFNSAINVSEAKSDVSRIVFIISSIRNLGTEESLAYPRHG